MKPWCNFTISFKKYPNSTFQKLANLQPQKLLSSSQVICAPYLSSLLYNSTNFSKWLSFHKSSNSYLNTTKTTSAHLNDNGNISKKKTNLKSINKFIRKHSRMFTNICKISWDRADKISTLARLSENLSKESTLNMSDRQSNVSFKTFLTSEMEILKSIRKSMFLLTFRHYINLLVDYPFGIKTKE